MRLLVGTLVVLGVVFGAAFASASAAPGPRGSGIDRAQQAPQPTEAPGERIPCNPTYDRTIEPRIVKEGDNLTVRSTYNYECGGGTRKINYFLVIENSQSMRQGAGGREALQNITRGARNFVNQVDYASGSQGGLVLFADVPTFRVPLIGGEEGRKALIEGLEGISIKPIAEASGLGAAIRDATGSLPTGVETDAHNVLIVVDAGAEEVPGSTIVNRPTACNAARQAGVTVVAISFPQAQRRLQSCASSGWFFELNSNLATNAPDIFRNITEGILRGLQMEKVIYSDFLEDGFDYVVRSGYPRDPDYTVLSEIFWQFGKTVPPTGQLIEYQLAVEEEVFTAGEPRSVSLWSNLEFGFQQGSSVPVRMPNPLVCVYKNDPAECHQFSLTLTPSAPVTPSATPSAQTPTDVPTATATRTTTATQVTPTSTQGTVEPSTTPSPTATGEIETRTIYLPLAERQRSGVD
jgi:hypothetical protein